MYMPNSMWTWAFVGVTVVQAAIVLALESYVFAYFQTHLHQPQGPQPMGGLSTPFQTYEHTIPTFLTLYIFGLVYQVVLVYDALRLKNTIQIIGICVYNVGLLLYAAVQWSQIHDAINALKGSIDENTWSAVRPFLIAIPCVIAVGTVAMSFIARKLYDEFAWTIYKHISADLKMKRRYLTYQIYIALLKFDFFLFLGFTIQFVVIVVSRTDVEFGLTIAAIPVTILILILAGYVTRKENLAGMVVIITLYFGGLAYFLFKLVRMYQHTTRARRYIPARRMLTTFAVMTIVLLVITITNAIMCAANFNQGLKPYIAKRKVDNEDEKPTMMEMPNLAGGPPHSSRMEID
ncbi:hypothetical protein N7G274_007996 [Stereocaulon virgatum]|uniref:Uncharacterized protein n=1 Tax=Stereocaulon virgatum TaxID=373712 RepID=A0ABR4A132_9LECA